MCMMKRWVRNDESPRGSHLKPEASLEFQNSQHFWWRKEEGTCGVVVIRQTDTHTHTQIQQFDLEVDCRWVPSWKPRRLGNCCLVSVFFFLCCCLIVRLPFVLLMERICEGSGGRTARLNNHNFWFPIDEKADFFLNEACLGFLFEFWDYFIYLYL